MSIKITILYSVFLTVDHLVNNSFSLSSVTSLGVIKSKNLVSGFLFCFLETIINQKNNKLSCENPCQTFLSYFTHKTQKFHFSFLCFLWSTQKSYLLLVHLLMILIKNKKYFSFNKNRKILSLFLRFFTAFFANNLYRLNVFCQSFNDYWHIISVTLYQR